MKVILYSTLFFVLNVHANITGTNIQNFNPVTDGMDYVTVHSPDTLNPGFLNFGFFLNQAANSLPSYENDNGERLNNHDRLTYADFNIGLGVMKNVDLGISFPLIFSQEIDDDNQNILFSENGLTEIRGNIKYRFTKIDDWRGAFILSLNHNLIENNPYAGEGAGDTINTEFAFGKKFRYFNYAFNVGYRFRNAGDQIEDTAIEPLEDQWIASMGFSQSLRGTDSKLIFELLASVPTKVSDNTTKQRLSSYEGLLGIKHDYTKSVALHGGFGVGLVDDTASPDWRIYAGLNWNFGPLWKKSARVKKYKVKKTKKYKIRRYRLSNLNFRTGKHKFDKSILDTLRSFLAVLKKRRKSIKKLRVEGHTDSIGDAYSNKVLSFNRAREVKRLIVKYSLIPAEKIKVIGRGESDPIADNGNFQGRAENRRVEVFVFE